MPFLLATPILVGLLYNIGSPLAPLPPEPSHQAVSQHTPSRTKLFLPATSPVDAKQSK